MKSKSSSNHFSNNEPTQAESQIYFQTFLLMQQSLVYIWVYFSENNYAF